ncbi:MAG: CDP-alcohol phosphatidyltransferase family protein [Acidobacteriota bacterium]
MAAASAEGPPPPGRSAAYRASLKAPELEERLDLILYRPLAFWIAWPLRKSRVSPNQVSIASMLFGVAAGVFFWRATPAWALAAALACVAANVLDCADGQLARLQGTSSPIGYLVDGAADYVGTTSVFLGMAHALQATRPARFNWWWLAVAAGASMAWQCAFLDEKRGAWLDRVYRRRRDRADELRAMERQAEAWRAGGGHRAGRALIAVYRLYRTAWQPITRPEKAWEESESETARWAECHRPVLRKSVWVGPTMHVTAIVVLAAALDRPDLYFWAALVPGNLWMLLTLAAERRAVRCAAA